MGYYSVRTILVFANVKINLGTWRNPCPYFFWPLYISMYLLSAILIKFVTVRSSFCAIFSSSIRCSAGILNVKFILSLLSSFKIYHSPLVYFNLSPHHLQCKIKKRSYKYLEIHVLMLIIVSNVALRLQYP